MTAPINKLQIANLHRFDIIVSLLFIHQHYKKNDYGYKLYKISKQHGPLHFMQLIESFAQHGFKKGHLLITNNYYLYGDGAHRLACCSYFNIANIPTKITINPHTYVNNYGLKWLQDTYCKEDIKKIVDFYCRYVVEIIDNCDSPKKIKKRINYLIENNYDDKNIINIDEYLDLIFINQ
jgi:hypothetical protein|tara:strand:+ start:47 stop:583 length:537 start_codon:yes stop_codon:yes gene_type:complete